MEAKKEMLLKLISIAALLGLLVLTGAWLSAGSVPVKEKLLGAAMTVFGFAAACGIILTSILYIFGTFERHGLAPIKQILFRIAAVPFLLVLLVKIVPPLIHDLINIFVLSLF